MMRLFERLCDPILDLADRLHIINRTTLDDWERERGAAKTAIEDIHAANVRDVEAMTPDERSRLSNQVERVYLHKRFTGGEGHG